MRFDELADRFNNGERSFERVSLHGDLIAGNLEGANLSGANMPSVNLEASNLSGVDLSQAFVFGQLRHINLSKANLSETQFSYHYPTVLGLVVSSVLNYANLEKANMVNVNLQKASLIDANLKDAVLRGANLTDADLRGADLQGANLIDAELKGANLCQANLKDAILSSGQLASAILGWTVLPDASVSSSPTMDLIASKLGHLRRPTWKPVTVRGDADVRASKFAGRPWLSADEDYPLCPDCQQPLRFFLQLNLEELPKAAHQQFGDGILQLFYCTNEDMQCDVWEPFSPCKLIRIVQPLGTPSNAELPVVDWNSGSALIEGEFPAKHIVRWQASETYPDWSELQTSESIQFTRTESEVLLAAGIEHTTMFDSEIPQFMDTTRMYPVEADRLAGYPTWLQRAEYPNCPVCNQLMNQLIFEFASDDNVPYLWGDAGTGYVLQCPEHKEKVTFFWQC